MRLRQVLLAAILLSAGASILVVQGQTKKSGVNRARARRTKAVKPGGATAAASLINTTPSGLIYIITRRSQGRQPRPGEKVVVHYTGLLGNGVKIDSSLDREQPFIFRFGVGQVIKGWEEGIGKLRVGEQATLIIPPQLGYGEKGAGVKIPPNATLIFIIELLGIGDEPAPN